VYFENTAEEQYRKIQQRI